VVLRLTGSRIRDVLAKGCPLDQREASFSRGQCAQSRLVKAPVLLRPVANGVDLIFPRSLANYVGQWLGSAAQEYGGLGVQPTSETDFLDRTELNEER